MTSENSFDQLLSGLNAGCRDAHTQLFQRFVLRLIGLARNHLDGVTRQKVDPDDVVQSAYRSFFVRFQDGRFELENWESLWGLLSVITLRKCSRWRKYYRTEGRDVRREVLPSVPQGEGDQLSNLLSTDPTPSEAAALAETVELFMRDLTDREREILELTLQGMTVPEVSDRTGRTERTVRRNLAAIRERLESIR